jgi:hypothetical protein
MAISSAERATDRIATGDLRRLPRSLSPLPDESVPGFLLRLAHRLDLSPGRVAALTGLTPPTAASAVPIGYLYKISPPQAEIFAHTTGLSLAEVADLTLTVLADRYSPADLAYCGRKRSTSGILVKENWIFTRFSRYCPDCLAGNDSTSNASTAERGNARGACPLCSPARPTSGCSDTCARTATTSHFYVPSAAPSC